MKLGLPFYSFIVVVLVSGSSPALCQRITFNKVPPPNGKSFKHVTGITQDPSGYIWLATKKGLYCHDGYQMIYYKNNPLDPNSLASDHLEAICADASGAIWIGTLGSGLDRFDPATGIFKHYRHDSKNPGSINADWISVVMVDHKGVLWVGTGGGLDRFDAQKETFKHFRNIPGDSTSLSYNEVVAIYEDRQGTLWVGTGSVYGADKGVMDKGGLNRLNKTTGKFTRYMHDPHNPNSLINNKVRAIFEDSKGNFWVGTAGDGLHTMDRATGVFTRYRYDPANPWKLSRPPISQQFSTTDHITFIIEDVNKALWIGTAESGINYYNTQTRRITHYESGKDTAGSFADRTAWWAYTSREGILWISTLSGELYRIDPGRKEIPHYVISSGPVNSFYEEENGTLWLGTDHGLFIKNKENITAKRYLNSSGTSKVYDNMVKIINIDSRGNLWLGGNKGLIRWNKDKSSFTNYRHDPKMITDPGNNNVNAISEDQWANLWIGTSKGVNLMDKHTGSFTHYFIYPNDTSLFGKNFITSVLQDKTGKMWVGAWFGGGVNLFNPVSKKFKNYLESIYVSCIYEDRAGILWVGSNDGLYRYNARTDNFIYYSDLSSLTGITDVLSIVEDNKNYLWLGTSVGFVRLNPRRNEISVFGKNYGVFENELIYNSCFKGQNGELYFGDATGYYSFEPTGISQNIMPPKIIFTGLRLADKLIKPGSSGSPKWRLSQVKEIRLHYNRNVFSIDYSAIDFTPKDYTHQEGSYLFVMLQNYNNTWQKASAERRAYYFNIPPGKYIFRVKASNSYGVWAENKIDIIILPPWWRTWWAYCLFGLLFIAGVYGVDRFQRRRLVQAERKRSREREIAQAKEMEKAYTELKATQVQLVQSEKMASLGELTAGIAHEIQNPLNFVNNFSEVNRDLLAELQQELKGGNINEALSILNDLIENEQKVNHHGKRAGAIVKAMLQHSRSSSGQKELIDINALLDEYLRLTYHGLRAKDKAFNATMKSDFDQSIGKINIIPQEIGRVILNLLSNAFYAVNEKKKMNLQHYDPTVFLSTIRNGNKIEIRVRDNGIGIPSRVMDKIFQPFFTTKPTGEGTGLGLSLSYDIITKGHGGTLKVDTKEGEGAEFIITIPYN